MTGFVAIHWILIHKLEVYNAETNYQISFKHVVTGEANK